jgi:hypothetical protein
MSGWSSGVAVALALVVGLAAVRPVRGAAPAAGARPPAGIAADPVYRKAAGEARRALRLRHGEAEGARIDRGVDQVVRLWRRSDGGPAILRDFLQEEFIPAGPALDGAFERLEFAQERIAGYFNSMARDLRRGLDLDLGPMLPIDRRLGELDPAAHVTEDLFASRVAFVVLLNFPLTTLAQRLDEGGSWSRRQWAEARLAQRFAARVPADVRQGIAEAYAAADAYINDYNIHMHHLLAPDGSRPFPAGLRLIAHWGIRDELKSRYADPDGPPKQRLIQKVMERIVLQEIPRVVVNNPLLDWDPAGNRVTVSGERDAEAPAGAAATAAAGREPDTRYRTWLGIVHAERRADPYYPDDPTFLDRRFDLVREIPETEARALLESVLASPLAGRVGRLIGARLGRPLEPFDVWYNGFKPRGRHREEELDALTRRRYPTAAAYAADIPRMLREVGFAAERARFVAERIVVEPSRGAGHALGAARRDDNAHLRTRVGAQGMDYKGYNIAVHEMGHNVEQVFSMTAIDHTLLQGVPNNAFTEALAFVFQARDLELLGLEGPGEDEERLRALDAFWATREIAGVGLIDIAAWRWLQDHPDATPARFREAVVRIARDTWNRHFAPFLGARDLPILAIYSHMVASGLYTPDYPIGHLIAFQVEEHFRKDPGRFGAEFERICRIGNLTPDAWMRQAVGAPLSAEPLLRATAAALETLEGRAAGAGAAASGGGGGG